MNLPAMKKLGSRAMVAWFTIIFLLMITSDYVSVRTSNTLLDNFKLVASTYQVINSLESMERNLSKAEADARGYYFTRRIEFNSNFIEDTLRLVQAIKDLEVLISNNQIQLKNLGIMELLIRQRLGGMNFMVQVAKKKQQKKAIQDEASKIANQLNRRIYALSAAMMEIEERLLVARDKLAYRNVARTKTYVIFSSSGSLLIGILFIILMRSDLKRRKNVENELRGLNENKDKFFSIISHDLKGPIFAAQQLSELITENQYSGEKERSEIINMMDQSIKKVSTLLEELLEWSRIQMNRIDFNPNILSLKKITAETIDGFRLMAENKKIQIHNLISDDCRVYADHYMTSTIVRNLLSNAIKFTTENKNVYMFCSSEKQGFVEVSVKDEGIGMDVGTIKKLFRVGIKHSAKGTSEEIGTGLGLLLCKEFAEKQGGKIWVESELGKGSVFTFSIPAHENMERPAQRERKDIPSDKEKKRRFKK